jgi:hypothetical protein
MYFDITNSLFISVVDSQLQLHWTWHAMHTRMKYAGDLGHFHFSYGKTGKKRKWDCDVSVAFR